MIEAGELELDDERRPYAPAANVIAVLERIRKINLPGTIDTELLRIAGVSDGAMSRVLFTLRFLRLTDANGRPTDRLRAIAKAANEDWRDLLGGVVREAYAPDFERLDPGQDPQPRIVSAFKRYEPRSQTERMVMLFLGLCRASGIPVLDAPRERKMQNPRGSSKATRGTFPPPPRTPDRPLSRDPRSQELRPDEVEGRPLTIDLEQVAMLDDEEDFQAAWAALGQVQRILAKARRKSEAANVAETADLATEGDDTPEGN